MSESNGREYTIDDTSPMFRYSPYEGGSDGWAPAGAASSDSGELEEGDSMHSTRLDGASVHMTFFGRGVKLLGTADCSYNVTIDGSKRDVDTDSSSGLYSSHELSDATHTFTLTAHPLAGQALSVNKAVIVLPFALDTRSRTVVGSTNSSMLVYSPQDKWVLPQVDNAKRRVQSTTGVADASVGLSWTGGVAVEVNGVVSAVNGPYTVTLDGVTSALNASSSGLVLDALLFFQAFPESDTDAHVLTVTNAADSQLSLNSITLYGTVFFGPDAQKSSTHHVRAGIIAGPVVGGVAALGLTFLLLFLLRRRRLASKAEMAAVTPYDVRTSRTPQLEFILPSAQDTDSAPHVTFAYPEPQRRTTRITARKTESMSISPPESSLAQGEGSEFPNRQTLSAPQSSPFDVERMMDMVAQRMVREGTRRSEQDGEPKVEE